MPTETDIAVSTSTSDPLRPPQYWATIGATSSGVDTPCSRYFELEALRRPCRDLGIGLARLRMPECSEVYMPRNPAEKPRIIDGKTVDPYLTRVNTSQLDNKFRRAVSSDVGRIHADEPALDVAEKEGKGSATPTEIVDWSEDVDGLGTNLPTFLLAADWRAISEGAAFVLVEYPSGADGLTKAQATARGIQPTWKLFSPANVIDWRFEKRGGRLQLVELRLREPYTTPKQGDEWSRETKVQVRVLRAGDAVLGQYATFEVWRKTEKPDVAGKDWQVVDSGPLVPQFEIPFGESPTSLGAPFESTPFYLDLALLNLAQWVKGSYLDSGQTMVGFPIPWAKGLGLDPVTQKVVALTEDRMILFPGPDGAVGIAETSGAAWGSVMERLKHMDEQAAEMMGAAEGDAAFTESGEIRRSIPSASRLASYVSLFTDAASRFLRFTAIYLGLVKPSDLEGWGAVCYYPQLMPKQASAQQLDERKWLHSIGALSTEAAFAMAKESGAIDAELEFEDEQRKVEQEGGRIEPVEPITPEDVPPEERPVPPDTSQKMGEPKPMPGMEGAA